MKTALFFIVLFVASTVTWNSQAQDVVYCKHGQTGKVIAIQAGHACPFGYYRI